MVEVVVKCDLTCVGRGLKIMRVLQAGLESELWSNNGSVLEWKALNGNQAIHQHMVHFFHTVTCRHDCKAYERQSQKNHSCSEPHEISTIESELLSHWLFTV